jgi:hypothetical protein
LPDQKYKRTGVITTCHIRYVTGKSLELLSQIINGTRKALKLFARPEM